MAQLLRAMDKKSLEEIGDENFKKAFAERDMLLEFHPYAFSEADKQAVANALSFVFNDMMCIGLVPSYIESYGKTWRMWIGRPTKEEMEKEPLPGPDDPVSGLMDILLGKNKKEEKENG